MQMKISARPAHSIISWMRSDHRDAPNAKSVPMVATANNRRSLRIVCAAPMSTLTGASGVVVMPFAGVAQGIGYDQAETVAGPRVAEIRTRDRHCTWP